jgi:hypothetical protein
VSKSRKRFLLTALGIVGFAILPILSMLIAVVIAGVSGCAIDEGSVHPCLVLGIDLGTMLYSMAVFGWFVMFTFPLAGIALFILIVAWIVFTLSNRPKRGDATSTKDERTAC